MNWVLAQAFSRARAWALVPRHSVFAEEAMKTGNEAAGVVAGKVEEVFTEDELKQTGRGFQKFPMSQPAYWAMQKKHRHNIPTVLWQKFVAAAKGKCRQLTFVEAEKVEGEMLAQVRENENLRVGLRDEQIDDVVPEDVVKGLVCAFTHNHDTPCPLTPTTWHLVWDVNGKLVRATADDGSEFRIGLFTVDFYDEHGARVEVPVAICEKCQAELRAAAKAAGHRPPRFCSYAGALCALQSRREWQGRQQAARERDEAKRKQMSAFLGGVRGGGHRGGYANCDSGPRDVGEVKAVTGQKRDFGGNRAAKKKHEFD